MPSSSEKQRRYMGAAYARKKAGKSRASDPKMSLDKMRHYAKALRKGAKM